MYDQILEAVVNLGGYWPGKGDPGEVLILKQTPNSSHKHYKVTKRFVPVDSIGWKYVCTFEQFTYKLSAVVSAYVKQQKEIVTLTEVIVGQDKTIENLKKVASTLESACTRIFTYLDGTAQYNEGVELMEAGSKEFRKYK